MHVGRIAAAWLLPSLCLSAQVGAAPPPSAAAAPGAARAADAAPVLENVGKPLLVPFTCGSEEINAFGLACTVEEPCPVYLELSGIETVGRKMFLSGNFHTSTTTLSSILLSSEDDGKTWSEPHERIRGGGLDQIQFLDFEHGWVAGHQLQALPRDPFFLLTTDGGKTWRRRPVFGDSQAGTIDQFWFDARDRGAVVIDRQAGEGGGRFARYESMTGGESWMIREVTSRPPRLKRTAGDNPVRRIRADGATQSFRIEKQDGQRWQAVASFLIRVGQCAPTRQEPQQEPPLEPPAAGKYQAAPPAPQPRVPPSLKKPRP